MSIVLWSIAAGLGGIVLGLVLLAALLPPLGRWLDRRDGLES